MKSTQQKLNKHQQTWMISLMQLTYTKYLMRTIASTMEDSNEREIFLDAIALLECFEKKACVIFDQSGIRITAENADSLHALGFRLLAGHLEELAKEHD